MGFFKLIQERHWFYFFIVLNLLPIMAGKFFPTMDGAAHLYNSNLINSLLFNSSKTVEQFFSFNPEPVPNWSGHFLLAFFNFFLPAFIAEKILLVVYVIGLPLAYRNLVQTINPENIAFSYFIFPFTYTFVFFLGFYNFSLALILLFLLLRYWIVQENKGIFNAKNTVVLFVLLTALYFSHVFVYGILLFFLILHILFRSIFIFKKTSNTKEAIVYGIKSLFVLLVAALPTLILCILYFLKRPPLDNAIILADTELISWLETIKPIIALNFSRESVYTKILFYLIFSVAVIAAYIKINSLIDEKRTKSNRINFFGTSGYFLFATIIIVVLYFTLPDSNGSAGYVSIRLALLFFLFLILWLCTRDFPKWIGKISMMVILLCHVLLNLYYTTSIKDLNRIATECIKASEHIEPNSIVLPLNYSNNWLAGHFSNYLGIDKPMVILENYEAGTGYFPLVWNEEAIPNTKLGSISSGQFGCFSWKSNQHNPQEVIDYIFILGKFESQDSCMMDLMDRVAEEYSLVYGSEMCSLLKVKG